MILGYLDPLGSMSLSPSRWTIFIVWSFNGLKWGRMLLRCFSWYYDKIPWAMQLKSQRFSLAHSLRISSTIEEVTTAGARVASHIAFIVMKRKLMHTVQEPSQGYSTSTLNEILPLQLIYSRKPRRGTWSSSGSSGGHHETHIHDGVLSSFVQVLCR